MNCDYPVACNTTSTVAVPHSGYHDELPATGSGIAGVLVVAACILIALGATATRVSGFKRRDDK